MHIKQRWMYKYLHTTGHISNNHSKWLICEDLDPGVIILTVVPNSWYKVHSPTITKVARSIKIEEQQFYHATVTNPDNRSILLSCKSSSSLGALVTKNISTISAVMLKTKAEPLSTIINFFVKKKNILKILNTSVIEWSLGIQHTLRTNALKSVAQAVHLVTASSGTQNC